MVDFGFAESGKEFEGEEFEIFSKGLHPVAGIDEWISTDKDEYPVFVTSNFDDRLVARFRFSLPDGQQGPPYSLAATEFITLARAFGVRDIRQLVPAEETTEYLLKVQRVINEQAQVQPEAYVNANGWVSNVNNDELPSGTYTMRFVGPVVNDEGLAWFQPYAPKNDTQYVGLNFEVVGDEFGEPSPYNGIRVNRLFDNPFDGTVTDETGVIKPNPRVGEKGYYSPSVRRLKALLTAYAPEAADGTSWEEYRWTDETLEDPMQVYFDAMLAHDHVGLLEVGPNNKGDRRVLKLATAQPFDVPLMTRQEEKAEEDKYIKELVNYIEAVTDVNVFHSEDDYSLTADGIKWCQVYVAPIWERLELPDNNQFGSLNPFQAGDLLDALVEEFGEAEEEKASKGF